MLAIVHLVGLFEFACLRLTFMHVCFMTFFRYIYLGETFTNWQLGGAAVTVAAILLVNAKQVPDS